MANIVVTENNTTIYVNDGDVVKIQIVGGGTVTIKAAPGSSVTNFKIHFIGDDHADTVKIDLATFSQNNLNIDIHHYDPSDAIQLIGGFNKAPDPVNTDEFDFSYIGSDGNTYSGHITAKDGGEKDFTDPDQPIIICFAEGAVIDTDLGPRPVESLRCGDLVITQGNGPQPVRWIGRKRLDSIDLMRHPRLYPVRVAAGALSNGRPYSELCLSQQHRVQLADWRTEYLFGVARVLVAVKHLVNGSNIAIDESVPAVAYYHLLFDRHEIVLANGAPVESLRRGDMAMQAVGSAARNELDLLFPGLPETLAARHTAQPVLKSFEAQAVLAYA